MTCRRIESLTWRKPINAVTRIRGSDDIKGQLHADRLWLLQSLCCLPAFSMLHCTSAPTPAKNPFCSPASSYWFVCLPLLPIDPLLLWISPTLAGKSMWHAWLLRDALSALRWEAKPRAGSGGACRTCFTFPCIRTNWWSLWAQCDGAN